MMTAPPGGPWFHALGSLSGLFFLVGVVLLVAWAIKHLSGERQKYWGGMFILAAVVLWLLSLLSGVAMNGTMGWRSMMGPRPTALSPRYDEGTNRSASSRRMETRSSVRSSTKSSAKSSIRNAVTSSRSNVRREGR